MGLLHSAILSGPGLQAVLHEERSCTLRAVMYRVCSCLEPGSLPRAQLSTFGLSRPRHDTLLPGVCLGHTAEGGV